MRDLIRDQLRLILTFGVVSAVAAWLMFLAAGGIRGALSEAPNAIAFLIGAFGSGWVGYTVRRSGLDPLGTAITGAATGILDGLLYRFPHTALLLLNSGFMKRLQTLRHSSHLGTFGINLGYINRLDHIGAGTPVLLPWWELRLALALVGAVLAGALLGAATASIGGSLARQEECAAS